MVRIAWVIAEMVAGVLVGGALAGAVVAFSVRLDLPRGPWTIWAILAVGITLCVVAGERFRKGLDRS